MENHLEQKLRDWKVLRDLLFRVREAQDKELRLTIWEAYFHKKKFYELKYHERFDKLKMPYN